MFAQAGLLDSTDETTLAIWIIVFMIYIIAILFLLMSLCCDAIVPRQMTGICLFNMAICGLLLIFSLVTDIMKSLKHVQTPKSDSRPSGMRGDLREIAALELCTKVLTIREATYHVFPDLLVLSTISSIQGNARSGWYGCGLLMRYLCISLIIWVLEMVRNYFMVTQIGEIIVNPTDSQSWCMWKVSTELKGEGILYWIPWDTIGILILCSLCACHGACHSPQGQLSTYKHCASWKANVLWILMRGPDLIISYLVAAGRYENPPTGFIKFCTVSMLLSFPFTMVSWVKSMPSLWNNICCCCRKQLHYEDDSYCGDEAEEGEMDALTSGLDRGPERVETVITERGTARLRSSLSLEMPASSLSSPRRPGTPTWPRGTPKSTPKGTPKATPKVAKKTSPEEGGEMSSDQVPETSSSRDPNWVEGTEIGVARFEILDEPPKTYPLPPIRHY